MYSIKGLAAHIIMNLLRVFPLQNKVVFCSFAGKTYGDNPQVIFEEFLKRKLPYKLYGSCEIKAFKLTAQKW